jgi:hypothetical protein
MSEEKRPPFKTFRAGRMSVALWRNEVEQDDRIFVQYSLRIQKRYRDKQTNEWKTAEYLYPTDLPHLIICAQKVFEFISLTEVDNDDNEELLPV